MKKRRKKKGGAHGGGGGQKKTQNANAKGTWGWKAQNQETAGTRGTREKVKKLKKNNKKRATPARRWPGKEEGQDSVCLGSGFACAPPLLAGCWGVCLLVCAPRLYPAIPGWRVWCGCVCLGTGFGCAPPLLAGVLGCVCVCVRTPLVPPHSWLGCAAWVCVFGLEFRLRPATHGWGVGVCVCLLARSACTPPLLVGVCSVGVCV